MNNLEVYFVFLHIFSYHGNNYSSFFLRRKPKIKNPKDLQIRTWSLKINKLKLSLRISKRFILVTSLYHKRASIGLLCKDDKCTIRNKCEIWIILICCYQSWKKLAIELLLNLSKNSSAKRQKTSRSANSGMWLI